MYRLIPALAVFLASCAEPVPDPAPALVSYRDPSVPIASTTRFEAMAFLGAWRVVADYAPGPSCAADWTVASGPTADRLVLTRCGVDEVVEVGPFGRLTGASDPIWVLWIAEDGGTAVLGTPSGVFGRILNRGQTIQPDRLAAAREVLAFNGYDLARLADVGR